VTASKNCAASKALLVFEALTERGFQGLSVEDIADLTGLNYAAVRRSLLVFDSQGWVVEAPQSGTKQKLWMPGEKLVKVAFQFKRHCLGEVHQTESKYVRVSGEILRDEP
jgi:DNA-binding IclR family transcriptional regulator